MKTLYILSFLITSTLIVFTNAQGKASQDGRVYTESKCNKLCNIKEVAKMMGKVLIVMCENNTSSNSDSPKADRCNNAAKSDKRNKMMCFIMCKAMPPLQGVEDAHM